ncbi:MAG: ADP-ribosylglycohydrolase family protein [Limnochordaceae bacterium]|nr:ADP-ribosylglycohydrolase family protein [Limnochordaceae bacterium]
MLADINGAMVTLALLYGGGDFDRTVQIAVQAGFDNDCNAATAGGIVGTMVGFSALPRRWVEPLGGTYYNRTLRGFPQFLLIDDVSERMAEIGLKMVTKYGGVEEAGAGELVIPVEPIPVAPYEPPVPEEVVVRHMARSWNPLWEVYGLGFDMGPGLRTEYAGRPNVFVTHPKSTEIPAELRAHVSIPSQGQTVLEIGVTNYDQIADCDWVLKVFVDDQLLDERVIRREQGQMKWYDLSYDLTPWAGREVTIRLLNEANGWYYEAGYWSHAEIRTSPPASGR